jgi:hypothetical protein
MYHEPQVGESKIEVSSSFITRSFSCLISTSCKILCTIGDAIVVSSSKECISEFKLDAGDQSTNVFLMRFFTSFHILGNLSDLHKYFHQTNASLIKVLATFLSFLLIYDVVQKFHPILFPKQNIYCNQNHHKKEGMEGYNNLLWKEML